MNNADMVAVMKMRAAEDDDGEACLDEAAESHNGDEWAMTQCEDFSFERDLLTTRQIADDSLIDIANALLAGNATWAAAKRMHAAVAELSNDYV